MTDFDWPWQYNFPPFFTIQINHETNKQQLHAWRQLVLDYLKAKKLSVVDVREAQRSPLFHNASISRQLSTEGILSVMNDLASTGHAEPIDKGKNRWYVFWEPLDEIGAAVYRWANANALVGTVCTLYELSEGDSAVGEIFYGLDQEVLIKALKRLEAKKKAELILLDDSQGVKFF